MTVHSLNHRRVFHDRGNFGQMLEVGTGPLESAQLMKAVTVPTADDLLAEVELEALELTFGRCIFWVRCSGETDEIKLAGKPSWHAESRLDISSREPWCSAIGLELLDCSFLIKGKQYHDRVQFTFGPVDSSITVQLEFAASQLLTYKVVAAAAA
jgi:hypothetical protein